MSTQSKILVPVDYSDLSLGAVRESFKYARFSNAKIVLLNVIEQVSKEEGVKLSKLAKDFEKESGIKIDSMILKGNMYEKIKEAADLISAKLIVMGLDSSSIGINHMWGRNAFKLIKEVKCPVVTVKENHVQDQCKNIVLPLDLSKESREKVSKAIEFAKFCKAPIRLISVFSHNEIKSENKLLAYVHQAKQYIKEKGVACSNKTVESNNRAQIIIDYANKIKADLIITTTQFETSLKDFFKGTISQQIVALSDIPVMSLPPMPRKDTTSYAAPF